MPTAFANPQHDSERPCVCQHTMYHHVGMGNVGPCVRCSCTGFRVDPDALADERRKALRVAAAFALQFDVAARHEISSGAGEERTDEAAKQLRSALRKLDAAWEVSYGA